MSRKGNDVINVLTNVTATTISVEEGTFPVMPNGLNYLKFYHPGQMVYFSLKNEQVSFLMDYAKWRARDPSKDWTNGAGSGTGAVPAMGSPAPVYAPKPFAPRQEYNPDIRILNGAMSCATGLVKSLIESRMDGEVRMNVTEIEEVVGILTENIYNKCKEILESKPEVVNSDNMM